MNDKKIAFIIAVNNERYFSECCYYISKLSIPDGFEIDILDIREAESMCGAYNAAMEMSDAKYKVYLHQDVFIIDKLFIVKLIDIFMSDDNIGLIGMMGARQLPSSGIAYYGFDIGLIESQDPDMAYFLSGDSHAERLNDVIAVDGLLMVTQHDLRWREDLFDKFDFYDISQSLEFVRHGYRVVVPVEKKPWVIHDCGFAKLANYERQRDICVSEYSEFFDGISKYEFVYDAEFESICKQMTLAAINAIESGNWDVVNTIAEGYSQNKWKDSELELICNINSMKDFFVNFDSFETMKDVYIVLKFLMRRIEYGYIAESFELLELIDSRQLKLAALDRLILKTSVNVSFCYEQLASYFCERNDDIFKEFKARAMSFKNRKKVVAYTKAAHANRGV